MKKLLSIASAMLFSLWGFSASAQDYDMYPETSQIGDLQWKLTWNDFRSVYIFDQYREKPTLTNYDDESNVTFLSYEYNSFSSTYKQGQVIFPDYGNYLTLNLETLNKTLPDGDYILTFPVNFFRFTIGTGGNNDLTNEEPIELYITIGNKADVEFPLNVTYYKGQNYMDLSWENVTSLTPGNNTGAYMVNSGTNQRYELEYLHDELYSKANLRIVNNNVLRLNYTNNYPDLPDGKYLIYIPENYVLFNGTSKGNAAINGLEVDYEGPWSEGRVEITGPDDNDIMIVKWLDASSIAFNNSWRADGYTDITGITIQDWDGDDGNFTVEKNDLSISGTSLSIPLGKFKLVNGEYRLYIPEEYIDITTEKGTYGTDGIYHVFEYTNGEDDPNKKEEEQITLYSGQANWNIPKEDGNYIVNYGQFVEVSWPGTTIAEYPKADDVAGVYNEDRGYLSLDFGTDVTISEDKTTLLLNLGNLPTDLYYSIFIPEAYVYVYKDGETYLNTSTGVYEMEIFVYNEEKGDAGVEKVMENESHISVFNINGVKVLDTDNPSDLQTLPKGFYIINGKKVVM